MTNQNTLYVDRTLKLQSLIQAYSRTSRIYGHTKEFGAIINFQYPRITEKMVKDALVLYGSGGKSSQVILAPYLEAVDAFVRARKNVELILADLTEWQDLKFNEEKRESFIKAFKEANKMKHLA